MAFFDDLIASAARAALTAFSRRQTPVIEGKIALAGLNAPVEILRDRSGAPHIYAQNTHDLFFAQGFVHAQERFWQMELHRRMARGMLSEILGPLALDTDRATRTLGFDRLGRADWENASVESQEVIMAYRDGVNAFLTHYPNQWGVEFSLLRCRPAPWTVQDTMAFMRLLIWQLSRAWHGEIARARLIQAVGKEHAADWEIDYPPENPLTLPQGVEFNAIDPEGNLRGLRGPFLDNGKGSNAWAIAGQRSETGKPFLCNDMHLMLTLPGIWMENHLVAGELNVSGVSTPALPTVLVGHNERIAWGVTLAFTDCEDLYIEQFQPENPNRFLFQGQWFNAQVLSEPIHVKGRTAPHVEKVVITRHGPVISDVVGFPEHRVALQSMALRPCQTLQGWLQINQAKNWDDFTAGIRLIEAPNLNICYADVDGNIGYWVSGKHPIRSLGNGTIPVAGWSGEYEWSGEVPFADMPHALNPQKGYVANCNNKIVPDDFPYDLGHSCMNGYRASRLSQYIESREKVGLQDFMALQIDMVCLPGQQFVKLVRDLEVSDPDAQLALDLLRAWDGKLAVDSCGGAVYETARWRLVRSLLEPALGEDITDLLLGRSFNPALLPSHEFYGNDTQALFRILEDPASWWVQNAGGRQHLLESCLKKSVEWLRAELGPEQKNWQWGRIHHITLGHVMGMRKPFDKVFNRGPFPMGGDTDTLWQSAMAPNEPYDNKLWAPSVRHIFDMGDLTRCQFILPSGQSGRLGNRHYDDLLPLWLQGKYRPMWWTRQQVEADLESQVTLEPSPAEAQAEGGEEKQ